MSDTTNRTPDQASAGTTVPGGALPTALADEEGSLVAEYGLLAVAGAAVCGALITFAGGNTIGRFFSSLLDLARTTVS